MTHTLPKHIFKRGKGYAVRFNVPVEARQLVGKKEIVRGLGTSDLAEALSKRDEVLREIRDSLYEKPEVALKVTQRNSVGTTIGSTSARWLSESDGINEATRARYRSILRSLQAFAGDTEVSEIIRDLALRYMDHLKSTPSAKTGQLLSQRSLGAYQICLSSYWSVLDHWGLVDGDMRNPFSGLLRRVPGQRKARDPRKKDLRPVTREEAQCLLRYIQCNRNLAYRREMLVVVRLLWVTACRLNEIAALRLDDIDDRGNLLMLTIANAKTEAGNRIVAIVGQEECRMLRREIDRAKVAAPLVKENVGMLFPRLRPGGYDKKPSHYLGKALERARKKLPNTADWDMHSFRRMGVSALDAVIIEDGLRTLAKRGITASVLPSARNHISKILTEEGLAGGTSPDVIRAVAGRMIDKGELVPSVRFDGKEGRPKVTYDNRALRSGLWLKS